MRMTWRTFIDHVRRIVPFMVKVHQANVSAADQQAVNEPRKNQVIPRTL